jgi:hypothetical protein
VGFVCRGSSQLASWRELPVDDGMVHYARITRKLIRLIQPERKKDFRGVDE